MISDGGHPQQGQTIAGRVVAMPVTAGSTSGPSVLADCLRRGVGPTGFILEAVDVTVLSAVMTAHALYGLDCFIHYLPEELWPADGEWFSWG
jgi:predicted aconitase with swiveling domain